MSMIFAYAIYIFGVAEACLFIGASFYAYRLTKLTGAFGAWVLMITALVVLSSHSITELLQMAVGVPFAQMVTSTDGMTVSSFIASNFSEILLPALLFSAMYQLHGKFRQLSK